MATLAGLKRNGVRTNRQTERTIAEVGRFEAGVS